MHAITFRGVLCLCTVLSACATTTPHLSDGIYRGAETSFRVGLLPPGWKRIRVGPEHEIAWHQDDLDGVINVNAGCDPADDIPLTALTAHLLIGFTDRKQKHQALKELADRQALFTDLLARLDGVQRRMRLVVVKKDGCVYDFGLAAVPGSNFDKARADFDVLLQGFETLQ